MVLLNLRPNTATTDKSILWERRIVEHKTNVLRGLGSGLDARVGVENRVSYVACPL
jgi:hypothetical protein